MNVKSLVGMEVVVVDTGKSLGRVERLLFSPEEMRVIGVVVARPTDLTDASEPQRIVAMEKIRALGQDAITVDAEADVDEVATGEIPTGAVAFDVIEKEQVITEGGEAIGEVMSLEFEDTTFQIRYLEVGQGFFSSPILVNIHDVVSIGEDAIIVRDSVLHGGEPTVP